MSVLAVVFIGILGKRIMICNAFDLINRDYIFRRKKKMCLFRRVIVVIILRMVM